MSDPDIVAPAKDPLYTEYPSLFKVLLQWKMLLKLQSEIIPVAYFPSDVHQKRKKKTNRATIHTEQIRKSLKMIT